MLWNSSDECLLGLIHSSYEKNNTHSLRVGVLYTETPYYPDALVAGQFDHLEPLPIKYKNVPQNAEMSLTGDIELITKLEGWGGSCVRMARLYYPDFPRGNAIDIEPNYDTPEVGTFVLTKDSEYGHIAIITKIENGVMTLTESNWNNDEIITHDRQLAVDDSSIRGYWKPVNKKLLTFNK